MSRAPRRRRLRAAYTRPASAVSTEPVNSMQRPDQQSMESDEGKRKKLVWEIERKLAEDGARPIIFYNRFAYCWQSQVKGWTMMVNSIVNNFRMEDVWVNK